MRPRDLLTLSTFHYVRHWLGHAILLRPPLGYKEFNELRFWSKEIRPIVDWYLGRIDHYWDIPAPSGEAKVTDYDTQTNAILSWANASLDYYPDHLDLPTDCFEGCVILDLGCGPIPHAQAFTGCRIYNLDPLVDEYRKLGFPLELHSPRLSFFSNPAERMPFESGSVDGVISVNAIDHVDDFGQVATEITRILKPDGILRFEVHYHRATPLEPWALDDEVILRHFSHLGIKKIRERPYSEVDPVSASEEGERLATWGNDIRS